jgi:hypothetical protein
VTPHATTFSSCSLDVIVQRKRTASCLTALPPPDLAMSSDASSKSAGVDEPLDWRMTVLNRGGSGALAARAVLTVPATVLINSISVGGVPCSKSANSATCELGDIAAGGSREILGTLQGTQMGSHTLIAQVSAANETSGGNNSAEATLHVTADVDLAIALTAPASAVVGTSATLSFDIQNMTAHDAAGMGVQVDIPTALSISSAQLAGTACAVQDGVIDCDIASLAAGETRSGAVVVTATSAGSATVKASISTADLDSNAGNNQIERTIALTQATAAQSSQATRSGGGGGGALLWPWLAALAGLLARRAGRSRPL